MDNNPQAPHHPGGEREPSRWTFIMLNAEQMRYVVKATKRLERPDRTLRIWIVALTYVKRNTGEVTASYQQLAEDASTTYAEVSRAMGELTRMGALIREKQGGRITYYVNPKVGWNGGEDTRRERAQTAPKLQPVLNATRPSEARRARLPASPSPPPPYRPACQRPSSGLLRAVAGMFAARREEAIRCSSQTQRRGKFGRGDRSAALVDEKQELRGKQVEPGT